MPQVDVLPRRRQLVLAALAGLAALAVAGAFKGYEPQLQTWGVYFWWMDYAYGFSKRALLGTLFQHLVASGDPLIDLRRIATIHLVACAALAVVLLLHARRMMLGAKTRRELAIVTLGWTSFFASQFFATTINLTGLTDVYLLLAFIGIGDLLRARRYWAAAALGFVVPFIHEGFMFLWTSALVVGLFEIARERTARRERLLVAVAPFVGALVTSAFHSRLSPPAALARAPFDQHVLEWVLGVQFGQTVLSACRYMTMTVFRTWWMNFLWASAFFLMPNVVIGLAATWCWRRTSRLSGREPLLRVLVLGAASLAPLSILLLAWDLSRFLVWANLACVIAWERLTLTEQSTTASSTETVRGDDGSRRLFAAFSVVSIAIVLFYAAAPLVVAFFPEAAAVRPYPFQDRMVRAAIKSYARPAPP